MSELRLGKLEARVEIDEQHRPRFGPDDPVTGNVILTYHAYTPGLFQKAAGTANLFGPIKITLLLFGKLKIRIRRDRELPTTHAIELFKTLFPVLDSTFQAEAGRSYSFSFTAHFPGDRTSYFEGGQSELLPPSFAHTFTDYPDTVDVSVRYQVGCAVFMPGIDIKIDTPDADYMTPVKYEQPRLPMSTVGGKRASFKHGARLQNEYLLPEAERPQGFKQKAKAVFTSSNFPVLGLDIWVTHPLYLYPGQKMSMEIIIRKNDSETTAPGVPDVSLNSARVVLVAATVVDSSHRLLGSPRCHDSRRTMQGMNCRTHLPAIFSKRNEYCVNLELDSLLAHPSSFSHRKVQRAYRLKFDLRFEVANKQVKMEGLRDIVLVCPPSDGPAGYDAPPPIEAGPSRITGGEEEEELPPPTYQEAQAEGGPSKVKA